MDKNIRMLWRRDNFWSLEASLNNDVMDRRVGPEEEASPCVSVLNCNLQCMIEVLWRK